MQYAAEDTAVREQVQTKKEPFILHISTHHENDNNYIFVCLCVS